MTKQLNITEQEELFPTECKLINLKYEHKGYTGTEKWAIVTELTEKELFEKYSDVISRYTPFVLLSVEQGKVISDFEKNEDKHRKRMNLTLDCFCFDDEISAKFHQELCSFDELTFEKRERYEKQKLRELQIKTVKEGIDLLTETQKRRLIAAFFEGKTYRTIAQEEGVSFTKIEKSVMQALKKLKKFLENRGYKS